MALSQDAYQSSHVAAIPLNACLPPLQNGGKAAISLSLDLYGYPWERNGLISMDS